MNNPSATHLHLDTVGGLAGDMFAAAVLDGQPQLERPLLDALSIAGLDRLVEVRRHNFDDGVLTGSQIDVVPAKAGGPGLFVPADKAAVNSPLTTGDSQAHVHRSWRDIRSMLTCASLPDGARDRTLDIFRHLAEAEASVHGKQVDDVGFHEVGAWDSIADIVMAGWLLDALNVTSCSCSALPLGRGRVDTAHGSLPVPTPATTLLLRGMPMIDDGIAGERITPTGAAILAHLQPRFESSDIARVLNATGTGFGKRRMTGISNTVRALFLSAEQSTKLTDKVGVINFEIDDQTGEELAVGLDKLRQTEGVLDVLQNTGFGKKGRLMSCVQILCDPVCRVAIESACLSQTTTLGLRWHLAERRVVERTMHTADVSGDTIRVKHALRPDGTVTRKADIDDLADGVTHADRSARRLNAESKKS